MEDEIKEILTSYKTIAVVGISNKPERDSYIVAEYLLNQGYKIIPVNPNIDTVLGLKAYPDLISIPEDIEIVDIFRRPEFVDEIVDQAIEKEGESCVDATWRYK
jgi:predicted CoA-binding protein